MKSLMLIVMTFLFSNLLMAQCEEGTTQRRFYYASVQNFSIHNCQMYSRELTCTNAQFASQETSCQIEDSGSCPDFWVSKLEDEDFVYTECVDRI